MLVDVCVATYKRPAGLATLLDSLIRQRLPEGVAMRIIVIDNDARGTARAIIDSCDAARVPIIYDVEPEQNISLARNQAMSHAKGDYVAFVDDDEFAEPNWIAELVRTAAKMNADAVFGPVLPILPADAPPWIIRGAFFERPRQPTGTTVTQGRTGNALLRRAILGDEQATAFPPEYGLTGGEDFVMFARLSARGARFVWCDEAIVSEVVGPERLCATWLIRRAFRGGQSFARPRQSQPTGGPSTTEYLARVAYALLALALGITLAPVNRAKAVRWLMKSAGQFGQVSVAVTNWRYREYANQ